jgi:hypothetical protein
MQDPAVADPLSPTRGSVEDHLAPHTTTRSGRSGGNASDDKKGQIGRMIIWLMRVVLTIAGIVILVAGTPQFQRAVPYDAGSDFASVEGGCTVTSVAYSTEERVDGVGNPYCTDIYTYTFSIGSGVANLTSGDEEHQRAPSSQCNDPISGGGVRTAEYAAGANVACWKPSGKNAARLGIFYNCGNPACIKLGSTDAILSPAAEHARKAGIGQVLVTVGAVFVGVGMSIICSPLFRHFCVTCSICKKLSSDDRFPGRIV